MQKNIYDNMTADGQAEQFHLIPEGCHIYLSIQFYKRSKNLHEDK